MSKKYVYLVYCNCFSQLHLSPVVEIFLGLLRLMTKTNFYGQCLLHELL